VAQGEAAASVTSMSYSDSFVTIVLALGILLLIFIVPIALAFFIARQLKSWLARALFIFAVVATPSALLFFSGLAGSSAKRIGKEHCISVPSSASNIQCEPFFAISIFLDGGGTASFEMPRNDLPSFLTQFKSLRTIPAPNDTTDWRVTHSVPDRFGQRITSFDGVSRDGNIIHMDVYNIDSSRVGVWVGTISN
jgi:hypothetical protein